MNRKRTCRCISPLLLFAGGIGYPWYIRGFSENSVYFLNVSEAGAAEPDKLAQAEAFRHGWRKRPEPPGPGNSPSSFRTRITRGKSFPLFTAAFCRTRSSLARKLSSRAALRQKVIFRPNPDDQVPFKYQKENRKI